jgi:anti-sigma28 factor (negative regulator of flagellin synthesis)
MIISRAEIESAVSAYRTTRKKRAQAAQTVSFDTNDADAFVSSAEASTLAVLAASVAEEPLYRDALVRDLQRRIAEGKYYVPSEHIVEKLLGRLMLEALPA